MAGVVRIGTSGWHYPHWVGPFYPEHLGPAEMLGFYARTFDVRRPCATIRSRRCNGGRHFPVGSLERR